MKKNITVFNPSESEIKAAAIRLVEQSMNSTHGINKDLTLKALLKGFTVLTRNEDEFNSIELLVDNYGAHYDLIITKIGIEVYTFHLSLPESLIKECTSAMLAANITLNTKQVIVPGTNEYSRNFVPIFDGSRFPSTLNVTLMQGLKFTKLDDLQYPNYWMIEVVDDIYNKI